MIIMKAKSVFLETFGESPYMKVLDFFLTYPSFDYSKTNVADEVEISRITIEKIWKAMIKNKIIIKTRTMGKAELYKLNTENPKVKVLIKIGLDLATASMLEKEHIVSVKR